MSKKEQIFKIYFMITLMIEANSFIFNIKLIFYSKAFLRGGLAGWKLGGDSALKGG